MRYNINYYYLSSFPNFLNNSQYTSIYFRGDPRYLVYCYYVLSIRRKTFNLCGGPTEEGLQRVIQNQIWFTGADVTATEKRWFSVCSVRHDALRINKCHASVNPHQHQPHTGSQYIWPVVSTLNTNLCVKIVNSAFIICTTVAENYCAVANIYLLRVRVINYLSSEIIIN